MKTTIQPVTGLALGVLLALVGWYMIAGGVGTAQVFGWFFVVVGVLSGAVNLVLMVRRRR